MLKQFIASKCDSNGFSREELNPFRDVILSTQLTDRVRRKLWLKIATQSTDYVEADPKLSPPVLSQKDFDTYHSQQRTLIDSLDGIIFKPNSIILNHGLLSLLDLIQGVMKRPYHTYLVVNYIFTIINWRYMYLPDKYPKLRNLLDMLERKLKFNNCLRILFQSNLNAAMLRSFARDFLLQFGMLDLMASPSSWNHDLKRAQKDKAKMFIDIFMLDGEVVLQRMVTQLLKVCHHEIGLKFGIG